MYIRVKSCCFGCSSLEQGSKAIAIIGLVFSVVGLVLNALALDIGSIVTHVISIVIRQGFFFCTVVVRMSVIVQGVV